MEQARIIGLDLAKNVFQAHGGGGCPPNQAAPLMLNAGCFSGQRPRAGYAATRRLSQIHSMQRALQCREIPKPETA